jgi:hypothetical protein
MGRGGVARRRRCSEERGHVRTVTTSAAASRRKAPAPAAAAAKSRRGHRCPWVPSDTSFPFLSFLSSSLFYLLASSSTLQGARGGGGCGPLSCPHPVFVHACVRSQGTEYTCARV